MNTEQQIKFIAASRKQRAAYFAWQNAPAGEQSIAALTAYRGATLEQLRVERDIAAARGDHAEALILNDRVRYLKEGGSVLVERVTQQFESALVRKRFYQPKEPS